MLKGTTHFLATTVVLVLVLLLGPLIAGARSGGVALSLAWLWATAASVEWGDAGPRAKVLARWMAAIAVTLELASLWRGGLAAHSIQATCGLLLLILAVNSLFLHLLRARRVTTEQILASITLMLLLGLLYAVPYTLLDRLELEPAAFTGLTEASAPVTGLGGTRSIELNYFSFVTLTTLGYGDITPVHPLARSLAALEALTGQLYIAVLVARLVALHIMHSREESAGPGAGGPRS